MEVHHFYIYFMTGNVCMRFGLLWIIYLFTCYCITDIRQQYQISITKNYLEEKFCDSILLYLFILFTYIVLPKYTLNCFIDYLKLYYPQIRNI